MSEEVKRQAFEPFFTTKDVGGGSGETTPGGSEKILVVEDDECVRDYVADQLSSLGYRVVAVSNGADALARLAVEPDIVLLFTGMVMPGMNGRQRADDAVRCRPGLKVIFTTGCSGDAIIGHDRLDPGVELLGKPYLHRELARKARAVLDR